MDNQDLWPRRQGRLHKLRLGVPLLAAAVALTWALVSTAAPMDIGPTRGLAVLMLLAMLCEYVDSSLGMGYGTTLTPLLLLGGQDPQAIVPCVLFSELLTGLLAGWMHHRDGNVNLTGDSQTLRAGALLAALSTVGALLAVLLALKIGAAWWAATISAVLLAMGLIVLLSTRRRRKFRTGHLLALGLVAAFNKGLSGGGYGPLMTAGQIVCGLPARSAVALTSLAESFTCLVALGAYLAGHGRVDWALALPLTTGALLSVPLATYTVGRISEHALRVGVGVLTCVLAGALAVKLLL